MAGAVRFDPILGRVARTGDVREQGASTYDMAAEAIRAEQWDEAAELVRYAAAEAEEGRTLYPLFADRARAFLRENGIPEAALEAEEARLAELLRLPDGSGFDLEAGWVEFASLTEASAKACEDGREAEALDALEQSRRAWLATHDRGCDMVGGLIDVCVRLLGEDRVAELWDALMVDLYGTRDRYDVDRTPWARSLEYLVLDTVESLRGHLSGPDRMGTVDVREEPDRIVFRFDPCGSGGRTLRPDAEGGPARPEPPFGFAVTTRPHDWSWGEEGVCMYCVHCCRLQQQVPIDRFGYPVRVVDPPRWPAARDGGEAAKCSWTIYKDPGLVPDEAYRRVGRSRPARLGSSARGAGSDAGITGPASPRPPEVAPP
jgi:hypothetical protein